jgi:hypothetical protein
MILSLLIFGFEVQRDGAILQTLGKHKNGNLLWLAPSAFLLESNSSQSAILDDLKKDLAKSTEGDVSKKTVCIFSDPNTSFQSDGHSEHNTKLIQAMLFNQSTPLSTPLSTLL